MPALSATYGANPVDTGDDDWHAFNNDSTETVRYALDNMPGDFVNMEDTSFTLHVRARLTSGSGGDEYDLDMSIWTASSGGSVLAGDTSTTTKRVQTNLTASAFTEFSVDISGAGGFVDTASGKSVWDGAFVELGQVYRQDMGKDGRHIEVAAAWITGNYNNVSAAVEQDSYRFRTDDTQTLNANAGWEAAINTPVSLPAEKRFRLRFGLQVTGATVTDGYRIEYRWRVSGGSYGAWTLVPSQTHHFNAGIGVFSRVMAVPSDQYTNNAATTELFGMPGTFVAGDGNEDATSGSFTLAAGEDTEIEFCLVVKKTFDSRGHTADGDEFEFRLTRDDGTALDTYTNTPHLTVENNPGLIGGVIIEQPGETAGPWFDDNGNIYVLIEASDNTADLMMMKSTDSGVSWAPIDNAGAPSQGDMEGIAAAIDDDGDTLHIFHHDGNALYYHPFRMSSHPTNADTWGTTETVDSTVGTPIASGSNSVTAVFRPGDAGGEILVLYHGGDGTDPTMWMRTGNPGSWNARFECDATANDEYSAAEAVLGEAGVVWFAYVEWNLGELYVNSFDAGASTSAGLNTRQTVSTLMKQAQPGLGGSAIGPITYYDDAGVEVITVSYHEGDTASGDDQYHARQLRDGTLQADQDISDSAAREDSGHASRGQGTKSMVWATGQTLHAWWIDDGGGTDRTQLMHSSSVDGAAWATPDVELDIDTYDGPTDGRTEFGLLYAAKITHKTDTVIALISSSDIGGTGGTQYHEVVSGLAPGGSLPFSPLRSPLPKMLVR